MNAVVVDIKGKYAAALDEDGSIIKIANANYAIGQTIELYPIRRKHTPSLKRIGTTAAAVVLILAIGTGTAYAAPYGTVTLDADSAIEYTINRFDRVLSIKALNEEGKSVLEMLDRDSLRFRPVDQAIATTLEKMEPPASADTDFEEQLPIQITAVTRNEQHTERLQEQLNDRLPERSHFGHPDGTPVKPAESLQRDEHGPDESQLTNLPDQVGGTSPDFNPDPQANTFMYQGPDPSGSTENTIPDDSGGEKPTIPYADDPHSEQSGLQPENRDMELLPPPGGDPLTGPSAAFREPGITMTAPPHGTAGGPAPGGPHLAP